MFSPKRTLVPVDFREHSRAAVEYASWLAREVDGTVTVIWAWTIPGLVDPTMSLEFASEDGRRAFEAATMRDGAAQLDEFLAGTSVADRDRISPRVIFSDPVRAVIDECERHDWVVLGTHGRTGGSHLLLGSVAEKIVRRAPRPVLTVRRAERPSFEPHTVPAPKIERIVVATDFSECSREAIDHARSLADRFSAELHVLHTADVVPAEDHARLLAALSARSRTPFEDIALEYAKREMVAFTARAGISASTPTHVLLGDAARNVVDFAKQRACDLIVMGTHGRTGFAHFAMGSVAEETVRSAPCPVLTVRSPT